MLTVLVLTLEDTGEIREVSGGVLSVGRGQDNDWVLFDPGPTATVSRRHCRFAVGPKGATVTDLVSTNGTRVNGRSLAPRMPAGLQGGEVIEIGARRMRVGDVNDRAPTVQTGPSGATKGLPKGQNGGTHTTLLAAFLEGAGLEVSIADGSSPEAFFREAGQMFAQFVNGLRELLAMRAAVESEAKLDKSLIRSAVMNPLQLSANNCEAVAALLGRRVEGYLAPLEAVDAGFRDLKVHQLAFLAGIQSAVKELLELFDPATLERKLDEARMLTTLIQGGRRAQLWKLYLERYGEITSATDTHFMGHLNDAFRLAYAAEFEAVRPQSPRDMPKPEKPAVSNGQHPAKLEKVEPSLARRGLSELGPAQVATSEGIAASLSVLQADAAWAAPVAPLQRAIAGKYQLQRKLGAGAWATVYEALDTTISQRVAIKVFRSQLLDEGSSAADLHARFRQGARAAGRLVHPNVVCVFDYGEDTESAWIVMEMVEGETVEALLNRSGSLPIEIIVKLMDQILDALAYIHSRGVVHRDIKPANIMLTRERVVKITDFGVAQIENSSMTHAGTVLGSPTYMAPEQLRGDPTDHRADVWAAGVILYQMLTGERPFEGSVTSVMQKALYTEPVPPSHTKAAVPAQFDAVVAKALAKRPEDRFASAEELAKAIRYAAAVAEDAPKTDFFRPPPDINDASSNFERSLFVGPAHGQLPPRMAPQSKPADCDSLDDDPFRVMDSDRTIARPPRLSKQR
jgi:serine/threonine protein kinase/predicted component of type VI protein secretion system